MKKNDDKKAKMKMKKMKVKTTTKIKEKTRWRRRQNKDSVKKTTEMKRKKKVWMKTTTKKINVKKRSTHSVGPEGESPPRSPDCPPLDSGRRLSHSSASDPTETLTASPAHRHRSHGLHT